MVECVLPKGHRHTHLWERREGDQVVAASWYGPDDGLPVLIGPTDFRIDERDWLMPVGERQVRDPRWLWLRHKTIPVYEDGWRLISVVSEREYTDSSSEPRE